jgi:threonine dehydratase
VLRIIRIADVLLVDESVQPGGSFKSRGTQAAVGNERTSCPFVTFSSGNHGIAVALEAKRQRRQAFVVVPQWAELDKVRLLYALGCTVVQFGETALECETAAEVLVAEHNGVMLHPYRSRRQIAGYATLWDEISQLCPSGADVVVPVGAGALLAAGVLFRKSSSARYHLIGAEPFACAALCAALGGGRSETLESRSLIAPALNVNQAPDEVLELVRNTSDLDLYNVTDGEIAAALVVLNTWGMSADPAAAAGVACILFRQIRRHYKTLVVLITGRGARMSAVQLRSQGVLNLSDAELRTNNPKQPDIRVRTLLTSRTTDFARVTDDKYG